MSVNGANLEIYLKYKREMIEYYRLSGFVIFPVANNKKTPACKGWNIRPAEELYQELCVAFEKDKFINIGLVTGKNENTKDRMVTVIDVDTKDNGLEKFHALLREHNNNVFFTTPTVHTPSGGYHFYFAYNPELKNSTHVLNNHSIDVRNDGGYVVVPPSLIGQSGYTFNSTYNISFPMIEIPNWFLNLYHVSKPKNKLELHQKYLSMNNVKNDSAVRTVAEAAKGEEPPIGIIEFMRILDAIPVRIIRNYDSWRNIIWAIKHTFPMHKDLVHYISKRDPENYNRDGTVAAIDRIWNDYNAEKNPPTIKTLIAYSKEPVEAHIPEKLKEETSEREDQFKKFDIEDEFYWLNFEQKWSKQEIKDRMNEFLTDLSRVFGYVSGGSLRIILKESKKTPIWIGDKMPRLFDFLLEGKTKTISDLIKDCKSIIDKYVRYSDIDFQPYTFNSCSSEENVFNLFRGFKARLIDHVDNNLIKPILDHIKYVWAGNNEEWNHWILSWLATIIQKPQNKIGISLILIGEQGCGKNIIINWFANMILGDRYYTNIAGFEGLLARFNSHLEGRLLISVDELICTGKYSKKTFDQVKSILTDTTINVERKGMEMRTSTCCSKFIATSNNPNSIFIEEGDRRFAIPDMSNKISNIPGYFDTLVLSLTQEIANHFATFLYYYKKINVNTKVTIPVSRIKKSIQEISTPPQVMFLRELVANEISFGESTKSFVQINPKRQPFILRQDLFMIYRQWCLERNRTPGTDRYFYSYVRNDISTTFIEFQTTVSSNRPRAFYLPVECFSPEEIYQKRYQF